MNASVLLLEPREPGGEGSLLDVLRGYVGGRCVRLAWDSFAPRSLETVHPNLIVAVSEPRTGALRRLFDWLHAAASTTPTLAVVPPAPDDELLHVVDTHADDVLFAPVRPAELAHRVRRLLPRSPGVEDVGRRLADEMSLTQLVGRSPAFTNVVEQIPRIARSGMPVLITGETGTGKELCARAIHFFSTRRDCPFIAVDCGALPDHLVENELFGHARGAFTDAHRDQRGLVGMAEGGTLFLDEVDTLSPAAQAKLLRFLQEHTFRPLGADRFVHADVNVIVATNRDLESCVRERQFRSDLYFRLNVLRLHLPPLRERRGDVELLARHFLAALHKPTDPIRRSFSAAALQRLAQYDWPGNIRELFNVVQRAAAFSEDSLILPGSLSLPNKPPVLATSGSSFRRARAAFERRYVEELLRKHHGNITHAASEAQKDRRAFGRLVKKYKIDPKEL